MAEFDLQRFITAQQRDFDLALAEIRAGRKQSHWIWYIFPQLSGLGRGWDSQYFGIPDLQGAREYLENDYLRENLLTITRALLALEERNPRVVLGMPDDLKVRSSMTLFEAAAPELPEFGEVLEAFYGGSRDGSTLRMLGLA